jgi:hypothetical protein
MKISEFEAQNEYETVKFLINTKEVLNMEEYERVIAWEEDLSFMFTPIGNMEFLNLSLVSVEELVYLMLSK